MSVDVSIVVPVFNAGVNLDGCMRSLLDQTLSADRYEIVLVDDGSTDGTGADIDGWVTSYPDRVRAFHEPHSGWPGRPRNVGVDNARGDYVHFVDSDDALAPHALERVLSAARAADADIVVPKSASDFRGVNHDLYRENRERVTWLDVPLVESLVPHKLVRRAFMSEHGLRFAEEPRHVEDQLFFVHAYAHAASVAVVADEVCYLFRRRRGFGRNLGDVAADPEDYYRDLEGVLDVLDRHVTEPAARLRLYERFYRVEVLGRLRDRSMLDYDGDYRHRLFRRIRRLVEERLPPELDQLLPSLVRAQARMVRDHNLPALLRYAHDLTALTLDARITTPRWVDGTLRFSVTAPVGWPGRTPSLDDHDVADVVVVGRHDGATWFVPGDLSLGRRDDGLVVEGDIAVDPTTVLGGRALTAGLWDVRLRLRLGGVTRTVRLAPRDDGATTAVCLFDAAPDTVEPYWTTAGGLALDVGAWSHSLADRVAGATRVGGSTWSVPDVVACPPRVVRREAELFVQRGDGGVTRHAAKLRARPGGSELRARRRPRVSDDDIVWVRVGRAGGSLPVRLT